MQIRFVGSGDAFGSDGRFQTCIRLQAEGFTVLVDCGATSLTAMKAQSVDPGEVDAVVVSHLHGDHFGGLPFLILDGQFTHRTKTLTVLGPAGTRHRLHQAMDTLFPGSSSARRRFDLTIVELDAAGGAQSAGPATARSWEVDHASGAPALGVRVRLGSRTFAYSGDTAWTPALLPVADGADVFACEAYTYDKAVPYHLDYATLRQHTDDLHAGQLIVTHMAPSMLNQVAKIDHPAASDGLVFETWPGVEGVRKPMAAAATQVEQYLLGMGAQGPLTGNHLGAD